MNIMRKISHALKAKFYFIVARYFTFWAGFMLRRWRPKIVVITGSTGKTTAFCLVEAQLGATAKYSHDANSAFGIPFDILGLKRRSYSLLEWFKFFILAPFRAFSKTPEQRIYVAECDTDRTGEGEFLAKFLRPHIVLWLNSTETHAEKFSGSDKRRAIARDYGWFVECAQELVVTSEANSLMMEQLKRAAKTVRVETYSEKETLRGYKIDRGGTEYKLPDFTAHISTLAPRAVWLAIVFARRLTEIFASNCHSEFISESNENKFDPNFSKLEMPPGRSNLLKGIKNTTLVDASYNSSLLAVSEILNMFAEYPATKKWIVIADMLEAGSEEQRIHQELAAEILKNKWQKVLLIGRRVAKFTAPILAESGVTPLVFASTEQAYNYLYRQINGGEAILFKGSQFLEMAIAALLENKSDEKKLAWRGALADKRRLNFTGKLHFSPPAGDLTPLSETPELVILPGWTYDDFKWNPLIDELRNSGAKVSLLQIPGLTGEKLTKSWDLENYVSWLGAELKNKKNFALLGHSNGGRIAIKYLAENSDKRATSLILIDSAGLPETRPPKILKRKVAKVISKIGKKIVGENPRFKKIFYRVIREHDYESADAVMKKTMQNLLTENLAPELSKIGQTKLPSLIIWGKNDDATPLLNGQEMARRLRGELEILPARHAPQFTNLDEVLILLTKFLGKKT